jgi:hypothetical protein
MIYLEIHNVKDGQKTFKCSTRYDWYILQNTLNKNLTIVKDEAGMINTIKFNEWYFIPNMMFDKLKNLNFENL